MTSFGLERPESSVSMACASQIGANPRFCDLLGPTEAKRTQDERTQGEGGRPAILDICAMFAMSAEAMREGAAAHMPRRSVPASFVLGDHVGARVEGTAPTRRLKRESMSA